MFLLLHSFVNLFAGGRSDSKTFLFFIYVAFLLVLSYFQKYFKGKISIWWSIVSTTLLYIYGLVLHIYLTHLYNLKISDFFITGNNGEISSTTLLHIHEAKGIIGFILSKFGLWSLSTIDAGGAYINIFPNTWFIVGTLILGLSLVSTVLFFFNFLKIKRPKNTLFLSIFWYAVVSFSAIKTALDGGILTLGILSILFSIYLYKSLITKKDTTNILNSILFSSIVLSLISIFIPNWSFAIVVMQSLATVLILSLVSLFIYGVPKKLYLIAFIIMTLVCWWLASSRDRAIYRYANTSIDQNQTFDTFDHNLVKKIENRASSKLKISDIAKGKNLSYLPVMVPGYTCFDGQLNSAKVLIQTKKPFFSIFNNDISIKVLKQEFDGSWWRNSTVVSFNNCLPEPLSVFDAYLRERGIDFYVMVNPIFYDESIDH